MNVEALKLPGCLRICPQIFTDERGNFIKTFVDEEYHALDLPIYFAEEYYSRSAPGVLRGLHFQSPPHEYSKLVVCIFGKIRDVILDLRIGSPFYGQVEVIEMDGSDGQVLYLPPGIAHGYLAYTEVMVWYKVTSRYAPAYDKGIRWDSIPVDWGMDNPVLSARDRMLPAWDEFVSPFVYRPAEASG